jgi:Asp-tRNA(Asn)/Glu-tRNA(Gln) amidotransferase A subunit family amidase
MSLPDVRTSARLVRDGEISARELVQRSLDAVAEIQPALNAFVHVDAEGALAAADASIELAPPAIRSARSPASRSG